MSLYQSLADKTEKLILDGILRPGERLPSVRQACRSNDISPITVTQAYYLLESRGLVRAVPRSGYFVAARASGTSVIVFVPSVPTSVAVAPRPERANLTPSDEAPTGRATVDSAAWCSPKQL